jgi:hypothetical protein
VLPPTWGIELVERAKEVRFWWQSRETVWFCRVVCTVVECGVVNVVSPLSVAAAILLQSRTFKPPGSPINPHTPIRSPIHTLCSRHTAPPRSHTPPLTLQGIVLHADKIATLTVLLVAVSEVNFVHAGYVLVQYRTHLDILITSIWDAELINSYRGELHYKSPPPPMWP